ncbi:hypothetical protein Csa_000296 [Cucumis sativus]|uniref:Uncharacterized protein n=1 Tax=Cucumis sativus TaxID=3659 RepID=A0A0A0KL29_CUCSA|nr:hypothetical protein Csa_000296 [Cucumis sativus]
MKYKTWRNHNPPPMTVIRERITITLRWLELESGSDDNLNRSVVRLWKGGKFWSIGFGNAPPQAPLCTSRSHKQTRLFIAMC